MIVFSDSAFQVQHGHKFLQVPVRRLQITDALEPSKARRGWLKGTKGLSVLAEVKKQAP